MGRLPAIQASWAEVARGTLSWRTSTLPDTSLNESPRDRRSMPWRYEDDRRDLPVMSAILDEADPPGYPSTSACRSSHMSEVSREHSTRRDLARLHARWRNKKAAGDRAPSCDGANPRTALRPALASPPR